MTGTLVLHEATAAQVRHFTANPVHAVLLTGPDGIGKSAIAATLVCSLLNIAADSLHHYPHYQVINLAHGTISIDDIRALQKFLQLKTIGNKSLRRAVLIEYAQGLTIEAQNALLKLLEEPPSDTLLILTVDTPRSLLPTIVSRVQTVTVHVPDEVQLRPLLEASGKDEAAMRQAYFLSGGLPGLLCALINADATHPLIQGVSEAKAVLQKTPFDRLAMVDALSKQKDAAKILVEALERIAEAMLKQAALKGETARIAQWHRIRKGALATHEALSHSVNAKLALSNLFLHL